MSDWEGNGTAISAAATGIWTPTTLCQYIVPTVAHDMTVTIAGGDIPQSVLDTALSAYRVVWESWRWQFRKTRANISIVSGVATADLPADFDYCVQRQTRGDDLQSGILTLTDDPEIFEIKRAAASAAAGHPQLAMAEWGTLTGGSPGWVARITPMPDVTDTFPIIYGRLAPAIGNTSYPAWPRPFFTGWEWLTRAKIYHDFRRDTQAYLGPYSQYKAWKDEAIAGNDKPIITSVPQIRDDNQDLMATTSAYWPFGLSYKV